MAKPIKPSRKTSTHHLEAAKAAAAATAEAPTSEADNARIDQLALNIGRCAINKAVYESQITNDMREAAEVLARIDARSQAAVK